MPDDKPAFNLDDIDFGQTIRGHQKDDRVFDRFVLKKLLGRGGMGVVWLALDERLGRDVALKFAPEAIRYDEIAVEELKEETRKGLDLAHPNIVKIYDFLLDEDYAAISMEFIDGENLGGLRTRQPNKIFEPRQITMWTAQLLDALDYAHRGAKVIHRDLKPANLMLDRSGNLRVTDFGIARSISEAMDRATLGRASTGTLAYMSPQQAGGKTPSVSDDIYAVGSTLYELLTGKPPFHAGNIAQQLRDEPATPPSERRREFNIAGAEPIPVEWERTILACLEKSPENRPPSALAVMERLGLAAPSRGAVESPNPATPQVGMGAPTNVSSPPTHHQTAAYVRPGAGLTEIAAPGRALTASKVQIGGAPLTPPAPTTGGLPPPLAPPQLPQRKKGHPVLWAFLFLMFFGLIALGIGVWWGWDHGLKDQYVKMLALVQSRMGGKLGPVSPTPHSDPKPSPDPTPTPTPTPDPIPIKVEPKKDPVVVNNDPKPRDNEPSNTEPTKSEPVKPEPVKPPDPVKPEPTKPEPTKPPEPKPTTLAGMLAIAKAGDTVNVPAGVYEEPLVFKEGVSLVASGEVVVQTDGKSGPTLKIENCKEGSISGFTFLHTGSEVGGRDPWPVALVRSSSVKLQDCTFKRSLGDGVQVTGAGSATLSACHVDHSQNSGILVERGATPTITHCDVTTSGGSGIEVRLTGSNPKLIANKCSNNLMAGIAVKDDGSASISGETECRNNKEVGILAVGAGSDLNLQGGVCEENTIGIAIMDGAQAKIKGVAVRRSKDLGVTFKAAGINSEMTDCTIEESATHGVYLFGDASSGVLLRGNRCTNSGSSGMLLQGAGFKPVLDNNVSSNNGNVGIYVGEGCGGEVKNNTCRGNKNGGIVVEKASASLKKENNITD